MPTQFSVIERGICSPDALDKVFAELLASPGWTDYDTKTSHRQVDQWIFDEDPQMPPPPHLCFLKDLMHGLMQTLQSQDPDDVIVPFQCFVCLYETGDDSCPSHAHDCRQLTLALGAPRAFIIGEQTRILLRHGDAIILDGERHALPKGRAEGPRASINIFYSTRHDMATRPVSVNHNPRNGYYTNPTTTLESNYQGRGGNFRGKGGRRHEFSASESSAGYRVARSSEVAGEFAGDESKESDAPASTGDSSHGRKWRRARRG